MEMAAFAALLACGHIDCVVLPPAVRLSLLQLQLLLVVVVVLRQRPSATLPALA